MEPGFEFREKMLALQSAVLSKHPQMPTLLREVHTALKKQPENVTLLDEDGVAAIFQALERQTGVFLADSVAKDSKSTTKVKAILAKGLDAF